MAHEYHPYFAITATVVCTLLSFLVLFFPAVDGEVGFGTASMSILLLFIVASAAISACVQIIHLQPLETTNTRSNSTQKADSEPLLRLEDGEAEEKTPEVEEIAEFLVPESVTIIPGPRFLRRKDHKDTEKIIYVNDFVATMTQDFRGGEDRQIKLLNKGDLVKVAAIKKGELYSSALIRKILLTCSTIGYWLVCNLEDLPKAGWIKNSYLKFIDLKADPIVYRDRTKPANDTVWYAYNPLRKSGGQKVYDAVEREAKGAMNWGAMTSVSFMNGYVTIGLEDSTRDDDLEKLPRILATWPARYNIERRRRLSDFTGGPRIEPMSACCPVSATLIDTKTAMATKMIA